MNRPVTAFVTAIILLLLAVLLPVPQPRFQKRPLPRLYADGICIRDRRGPGPSTYSFNLMPVWLGLRQDTVRLEPGYKTMVGKQWEERRRRQHWQRERGRSNEMPDFSRYLEIIADPSQPVRELMAGLPANSQYYGGFEFVDSVHCKPFPLVYFPVFITNTGYDPVDIARGGYIFAYGDYLDIKTGWRNEYFFTRFCGTGAPPPDQLYPGEMLVTLVEFETRNAKPGAYRIRIGDAVSNVFIL